MPRFALILLLAALIAGAAGIGIYLGGRGEAKHAKAEALVRPPAAARKADTLTVWCPGDAEVDDGIRETISSAETALGLTIDLRVFHTQAEYVEARRQAMADGTLPDLFWVGSAEAEGLDRAGALHHVPLQTIPREKWIPQTLVPFTRGDALLAYPSQYSVLVLFYNKADFDKIGVAYPGPHWNWDTLVSLCRVLYKPAQDGDAPHYALEFAATLDLWNAFAAQAGGPVYRGSQWLLGAPGEAEAQREALRFLIELRQTYLFCAPPTAPDQPTHFEKGEASLLIGRSEIRDDLKEISGLDWGVTVLPYRYALDTEKHTRATPLRVAGWAVSAHTPDPESAGQLAERLSTFAWDGWLSARRDASNEADQPPIPDVVAEAQPFFIDPQAPAIIEKADQQLATLGVEETDADRFLAKFTAALAPYHLHPSAAPAPSPAPIPAPAAPASAPAPAPKPAVNVR
jgi:ABC-type glycerol-3-phosphate transport system substrate-binding protein